MDLKDTLGAPDKVDYAGDDLHKGPITFLFGAGMSVDAGYPTSHGLIDRLARRSPELAAARRHAAQPRDIEALAREIVGNGENATAFALVSALKQVLSRPARASYMANLVVDQFPGRLAAYQPVFTLNYDTLFEDQAEKIIEAHWRSNFTGPEAFGRIPRFDVVGRTLSDGFVDLETTAPVGAYQLVADADRFFDGFHKGLYGSAPMIAVHKLHGSSNWFRVYDDRGRPIRVERAHDGKHSFFRSPSGETLGLELSHDVEERDPAFYQTLVGDPLFFVTQNTRNVVKWSRMRERAAFSVGGLHFVSCITFGTDRKLSTGYPAFGLTKRLDECIRTTWLLVVVGYGFQDDYINELVRARTTGEYCDVSGVRAGSHRCTTIIVDPCAWTYSRTGVRTIDDPGRDIPEGKKLGIYVNATAKTFAAGARRLIGNLWLGRLDREASRDHEEVEERFQNW